MVWISRSWWGGEFINNGWRNLGGEIRMRVRVRVLFTVRDHTGAPTIIMTAAQKELKMPFPPVVGLDLAVGEDDITITQVVFDDEKQRYNAYCEYDAICKKEVDQAVGQLVKHGWTHDPH